MKKLFFFALLAALIFSASAALAAEPISVVIFSQTGCPHCASALTHLQNLRQTVYPNLNIINYDLKDEENIALYRRYLAAYNKTADSVPLIFVGDSVLVGYNAAKLNWALEQCSNLPCVNPENKVLAAEKIPEETSPETTEENNRRLQIIGWIVAGGLLLGFGFILNKKIN